MLGVASSGGGASEIVDAPEEEVADEACSGTEGVGAGVSAGAGAAGGGTDTAADFDALTGLGAVGRACLGDTGVGNGAVDAGVSA